MLAGNREVREVNGKNIWNLDLKPIVVVAAIKAQPDPPSPAMAANRFF